MQAEYPFLLHDLSWEIHLYQGEEQEQLSLIITKLATH